jgi:hypothetical protein
MYEIKNRNSTAPAEQIDQKAYDLLKERKMLAGFDIKKVETPRTPAELEAGTTGGRISKTEKAEETK